MKLILNVKAEVAGASITTVTFTNRSTLALLRVCKAVGGGVNPAGHRPCPGSVT